MLNQKRNPDLSGKTKKLNLALTFCIMLLTPLFWRGVGGEALAQVANGTGAGNCLSFNGTTNYVSSGDINSIDNATKLTIELWVYPTNLSGTYCLITKWIEKGVGQLGAWWSDLSGNQISGACIGGERWTTTNANLQINTWYHVVTVFDGTASGNENRYKCYVNGILMNVDFSTYTVPAQLGDEGTQTVNIGTFENGKDLHYGGILDEVRIWNRALTQTEIRDNLCKKLQGNESGLVGYWRFDEGSGGTAYDASGNGNDGTLY